MASLNLSTNGPSIKSSYQAVVNGALPSSGSPTYAHWALFSVQAPLLNAFQDSGAKESVLKVESTGDGELADLVEDFNEGRIQFVFLKVKDPNSGLPKNVLIAWCGGGVPERTKGYFTSHLAAVSKILHGYHVQITARSDSDVVPETILQKVADASGAKYSAGTVAPTPAARPPPPSSKPVFTPTSSSAGRINPILAARNRRDEHVDEDGWGADAPQITRTQLEKVDSAYKPTRVNMAELTQQTPSEPPRFGASQDSAAPNVVRGAYQPVGKVDIAAIRAAAKNQEDFRPTPVKGAYEPVGKVDIGAIRARAQAAPPKDEPEEPKPRSLAERSAAFSEPAQSERLTSLPKPKVSNRFGSSTSTFAGTKPPAPGGIGFSKPAAPAPPVVGTASRTFADQGGKTPAQIWAEKKGKKEGVGSTSTVTPPLASPIGAQQSGGSEWRSGYTGKSWAPVQTATLGRNLTGQKTGGSEQSAGHQQEEEPVSGGGVSALKERFKDTQPIGSPAPSAPPVPRVAADSPPPLPSSNRPPGAFALPGLPSRPPPADEEEFEEEPQRSPSPPRVAVPVPRSPSPPPAPEPARSLPTRPQQEEAPRQPSPVRQRESYSTPAVAAGVAAGVGVGAVAAAAAHSYGDDATDAAEEPSATGQNAIVVYDYEKAEDNEIDLREDEYVTDIDMVDDDWWLGTNNQGDRGLFPSNYVRLVDGADEDVTVAQQIPEPAAVPVPNPVPAAAPAAVQPAADSAGPTATAQFDYEAAEDNELSFGEGDIITDLEFPDEDWWFGHFNGASGLFPANYVELNQ